MVTRICTDWVDLRGLDPRGSAPIRCFRVTAFRQPREKGMTSISGEKK